MSEIKEKQLIETAEDMQKEMHMEDDPPVKEGYNDVLDWITEAAQEIDYANDEFKDSTVKVLVELELWKGPEEELADEAPEATEPEPEPEATEPEPEKVHSAESADLIEELDDTHKLSELKKMIKANDEFKSLRGSLTKYKSGDEETLKEDMFAFLDEDEPPAPKKRKKKPDYHAKSAPEKAAVKKSTMKSKDTPGKSPTKGTMAAFMDEQIMLGGTWEEIVEECQKESDSRELSTKYTPALIRAHIKFRSKSNPNYLGKLKQTDGGIEE